jgi:hypothetical protein
VLVNGRQVDPLRYRLPQPVDADPAVSAGPGTAEPASVVVPGSGTVAAPTDGSHETLAPATAAPAPF